MSRCRETAGILFKHQCSELATSACVRCQKPICATHARPQGYGLTCISCLREAMNNPAQRHNLAHLRDDPYFFWYYSGSNWFSDPYGQEDYTLFDSEASDFASSAETEWHGS